jgi:hypothetical protein
MFFDDDYFLHRIKDCDRQHVGNWFKMLIFYLHTGIDRVKLIIFLTEKD